MATPAVLHAVPVRRSLDDLLAVARSSLDRLTPRQAWRAQTAGALLVDIRSATQRTDQGGLPGALVLERNELERHVLSAVDSREVVVICSDGVASSLAAASLQALGLFRATDVEGGFLAWLSDELPRWTASEDQSVREAALQIDADRWEARVDGSPVHLTAQEFRILNTLFVARGRVVSRTLLGDVLDIYPADGRALDVHICRLRRKLGAQAPALRTVRGVGWRLLLDGE